MTDKPRFRLGFLTHVQGRGDPVATYRNAQELFVVADELGFDVGWVAQHHAPLGGGGLPSPWTFLAHAAARTKRIRLSTAITVLPLENPYWKVRSSLRETSKPTDKNSDYRPLTAESLVNVCSDPQLGFVIAKELVGFDPVTHMRSGEWKDWNLYDCRRVRSPDPRA